jgi:GT2 family glycosyltransferase
VEVAVAPIALPTFEDDPRASIIIVTFGGGALLERCLARLAATVTRAIAFETIIVINSAREGRADELRDRVSGVRVEALNVNLGLAGALNRARTLACGEFFVLLHDDAEVEPGWLRALIAAADDDPGAGAVGSLVLDMDGGVQAAGWELEPDGRTRPPWGEGEPAVAGAAYAVDYCGTSSLLVRAASWDRVGGADERLYPAYYVDVDLCLALRAYGERVLCEPRSVIRHRRGASTHRDFAHFIVARNRLLMLEKWGSRITTHVPGSGATAEAGQPGDDVPRPSRDPDPARQEQAHRDRAERVAADYAADLRGRLDRAESALTRVDVECTRLRAACGKLERGRARQDAELERLRKRERDTAERLAELDRSREREAAERLVELHWLREREATLQRIEAGGWWRLRGRLLPLLRLAGRLRR